MKKIPQSVEREGGAFVDGDVTAGTFIGRDQVIVLTGFNGAQLEELLSLLKDALGPRRAALGYEPTKEWLTVTGTGAPPIVLSKEAAAALVPVAARQGDENAYLAALLVNPRYGRWWAQFVPLAGTLAWTEHPPGWEDVPPEFTLLEPLGEGAQRQIRRTPLDDIHEATRLHDALVVLGAPGSGKTTALCKLAFDGARQRLDSGDAPLPVFVSLAEYRGFPSPYAFLEEEWRRSVGELDLTDHLRGGRLLLLCDSLNEMPFADAHDYRAKMAGWREFVKTWPGNQVVFSCRQRDYGEPLGLPQVEIEPFDDPRVQRFLEKYLPAVLAEEVWGRLSKSALLGLMRNPYYLYMLCYIVASNEAWPGNGAAMFDGFTGVLLKRETLRRHPDWPGGEPLRAALASLAERMQALGEGTRLPRTEAIERLAEGNGVAEANGVAPEQVITFGLAASLLETELGVGEEELVRFYHHQVQEYFSARALLDHFRAGKSIDGRWQVARTVEEMPDPGPLAPFEPLPPPPPTGWEEPTVLAAGLCRDVGERDRFVSAVCASNPTLAARCLAEVLADSAGPAAVSEVQQALLGDIGNPKIHLRARLAAGKALGRLGDPRFEAIDVNGRRVLVPPFVSVPAGPFRMGSSAWEVFWLAYTGFPAEDERPRHRVNLPAFYIARFPVTNAEYRCFIEDRGYQDDSYWPTEAARGWLSGVEGGAMFRAVAIYGRLKENPTILQQCRAGRFSEIQLANAERLAARDRQEAGEHLERCAARSREEPAYWHDERYGEPAQPVVGVSWYEAVAYTRWLDRKLREAEMVLAGGLRLVDGYEVRLPTEAQWEKTARMRRGWRYPWGKRWDPNRANTVEGRGLHPSPVGAYPLGATPEGIHDLAGNVWEWTQQSLSADYPYRPGADGNALAADGDRTVRGGSWFDDRWVARCACRDWYIPDGFCDNLGFRVVLSLANSGS